MSQSNRSNRSRGLQASRAPRSIRSGSWLAALAARWSTPPWRAVGGRVGATALLLVCVSLLTGARLGGGTLPAPRHVALRVSPPAGLPPVARWMDVAHGTAYTVALPARAATAPLASAGYRFTFTTPAGDQLEGALFITRQPDGSFTQSTPLNASGTPTCVQGGLNVSKSGALQAVVYTLVARFDQYALVAHAHLVYALANDQAGAAAVCAGQTGQGNAQALDMDSGCTATACSNPVDMAGPTVIAFETSVVSVAKQGNAQAWKQVYVDTSRVVTAQYSADRFGELIQRQAQKQGRIVSITPATVTPQVQFDAAGQAYFSVTDAVKLDKGGGNTATVTITSYYLLESGQWVFWFSMPVAS